MLTTQMTAYTNGNGNTIGWYIERDGRTEAYIPGSDLSPAFIGDFPHAPGAKSAILDWAEETATAAEHAASLILMERDRLNARLRRIETRIARLNRAAAKDVSYWERRTLTAEITRSTEEAKLVERMLLSVNDI